MAHLQYIHPSKTHHHPHIPQSHLSSLISLACLFPSHTLLPRSSIHHSVAFVRVEGGEWVGWGAKSQPRSSSANVSVKPCLKQNLSWLTTVDRRDVQLWTLSSFLSLLALSPQLQHSQALGVEKSSYDGLGDRWRSSSHSPPSLVHDIGSERCSLLKSPSHLGRWPLDTPPSLLDTKWVVKVWLVWGLWSFYSYSYSTSKRTVLWFGSDSHRLIDRSIEIQIHRPTRLFTASIPSKVPPKLERPSSGLLSSDDDDLIPRDHQWQTEGACHSPLPRSAHLSYPLRARRPESSMI